MRLVFSYAAQLSGIVGSIIFSPLILLYVGKDAFGVLSFFSVMESWFLLLNLGLLPIVMREAALDGDSKNIKQFSFYIQLKKFFYTSGIIVSIAIFLLVPTIIKSWLIVPTELINVAKEALYISVVMFGFRWVSGFYRAHLTGAGCITFVSNIAILASVLRYPGAFVYVKFYTSDLRALFIFLSCVAAMEFFLFYIRCKKYEQQIKPTSLGGTQQLKMIIKLAGSVSVGSLLWSVTSQMDRFVSSHVLDIGDFGIVSLILYAANALLMLSSPLTSVYLAKIADAIKSDDTKLLKMVYGELTRYCIYLLGAITVVVFVNSKFIIETWLNREIGGQFITLFGLILWSNFIISLTGLVYTVQFVLGNLRYHLLGTIVYTILYIPVVYLMGDKFGILYMGASILLVNFMVYAIWYPFLVKKFVSQSFSSCFLVPALLIAFFYSIAKFIHGIHMATPIINIILTAVTLAITCLIIEKTIKKRGALC